MYISTPKYTQHTSVAHRSAPQRCQFWLKRWSSRAQTKFPRLSHHGCGARRVRGRASFSVSLTHTHATEAFRPAICTAHRCQGRALAATGNGRSIAGLIRVGLRLRRRWRQRRWPLRVSAKAPVCIIDRQSLSPQLLADPIRLAAKGLLLFSTHLCLVLSFGALCRLVATTFAQ